MSKECDFMALLFSRAKTMKVWKFAQEIIVAKSVSLNKAVQSLKIPYQQIKSSKSRSGQLIDAKAASSEYSSQISLLTMLSMINPDGGQIADAIAMATVIAKCMAINSRQLSA